MDADIIAAAREQRLDAALATFPDEIAAAVALAREQRAALAALPLDVRDTP